MCQPRINYVDMKPPLQQITLLNKTPQNLLLKGFFVYLIIYSGYSSATPVRGFLCTWLIGGKTPVDRYLEVSQKNSYWDEVEDLYETSKGRVQN